MHRQSNAMYSDKHLKTTYFAASVIPELATPTHSTTKIYWKNGLLLASLGKLNQDMHNTQNEGV